MEYVQKLTSTRAGTIAFATLAALVAGVAILVYLNRYRESVDTLSVPVTVLVAKKTIQQGTPGTAIAAGAFFTTSTIAQSQLRDGAFTDPASLHGQAATRDIYPGQQLTAADFAAGGTTLAASLTKAQRLITIPLDSAHGLIGQVQAGDHVDVFAGFNVIPIGAGGVPLSSGQARAMLRLVMENIPVVEVEKKEAGSGASDTTNVSLRVTDAQAAKLAFTSDNGKLWLTLRPAAGAKPAKPGIVTVETLLLGIPPITVVQSLGGRS
jgi:Flp pilus assembly protein CpaB